MLSNALLLGVWSSLSGSAMNSLNSCSSAAPSAPPNMSIPSLPHELKALATFLAPDITGESKELEVTAAADLMISRHKDARFSVP